MNFDEPEYDSATKLTTQNIEIRDIPIKVVKQLNGIAALTGRHKWEVIRDALCEYVTNHTDTAVRAFKENVRKNP